MTNFNEDVETSQTTDEETREEDETSTDDIETGETDASDINAELEALRKENEELKKQRRGLSKKVKEGKTAAKTEVSPDLQARIDQLELDSLGDISEQVADEVKSYSQLKGITLKQAYKSEYIQFMLKQEAERAKIEDASLSPSGKTRKATKTVDFANASPSDFDLSTPEGEKQWEQYKAHLRARS